MHILYLSFPGGGLDTNVRVLAPALVHAGHRVSVLYIHPPGRNSQSNSSNGVNEYKVYHAVSGALHYYLSRATLGVTRLPRTVRAFEEGLALQKIVGEIQKQSDLDLIELPEIFVTRQWLHQIPYIVRLHSADWIWGKVFDMPSDIANSISAWLEGISLRHASGISSPSATLAGHVRQIYRGRKPITIIPYPVDTDEFKPGIERANPPVILFVGRVEKRKGADVLMRAISSVWRQCPHSEFVFAGRVCDDVKDLVSSMPSRVQFLGTQLHEKLVPWYQRASVSATPSLWDNSPNTIYEAMACGTPVVASRVGGIPELVDHGSTGLLVPADDSAALADAIVSLVRDEAQRERMGKQAREKAVAQYALNKIANQTVDFYNHVLEGVTLERVS